MSLTWGGTVYRIWVNTNSTAKPTMQFNSPQDFVNDQLSTVTIVNATPGNGVRATQIGLFVQRQVPGAADSVRGPRSPLRH